MNCLNCDSTNFENKKVRLSTAYAGEAFEVVVPAFVCKKCKEPLMDSKQMNVLRQTAADTYREKHQLLKSHDIVKLRKKLRMSQRQFATYLGIGEASIKRWETYYVQEVAMDEHIRLKCDKEFAEKNVLDVSLATQVQGELTGNRSFSWERFSNATLALVSTCKSPLFINKALFYLDFKHFEKHGVSITGSTYAKLDYGPCPDNYRMLFKKMFEDGLIKESKGHDLVALRKPDMSVFDDNEIETFNFINNLSKKDAGKNLYNLSHEEDAYTKSSMWNQISYKHAKKLKLK
jgi:putative zinc finger/helix-turn-helix YgiT family protein